MTCPKCNQVYVTSQCWCQFDKKNVVEKQFESGYSEFRLVASGDRANRVKYWNEVEFDAILNRHWQEMYVEICQLNDAAIPKKAKSDQDSLQ